MAKEILITQYRVFNDRGSINSKVEKTIEINASKIVVSNPLPSWTYSSNPPIVDYYDGECMELSFEGKTLKIRVDGDSVQFFSADVPNDYVHESVDVYIQLKSYADFQSSDFAGMFLRSSYNALVYNALPLLNSDSEAVKYFLRIFTEYSNIFLMSDDTIETLWLYADGGNKYACYAYGYYHLMANPDAKSAQLAEDYLTKAYDNGVQEAAVALAIMYRYGDIGFVDRLKAKSLLMEALEKENYYAAVVHVKDIIHGRFNVEADPKKAISILNMLIEKEPDNPKWYHLRADAKQELSLPDAKDDYLYAAENGILTAWGDWAYACSFDEKGEFIGLYKSQDILKRGCDNRCYHSIYLSAIYKLDGYDNLPEYRKLFQRDSAIKLLEQAFHFGSSDAAIFMGDIYYNGYYDIEEDDEKAWTWYVMAAMLMNATAYEKMFYMIEDGIIEEEQSFTDYCAISAARLGSDKMLRKIVKAYFDGRLTEYAAEIEQYYIPKYNTLEDELEEENENFDDDDYDEEDGRYDAYV